MVEQEFSSPKLMPWSPGARPSCSSPRPTIPALWSQESPECSRLLRIQPYNRSLNIYIHTHDNYTGNG